MALHRLTQAVSARPCRIKGTSWARAFANAMRNCAVSALHLRPLRLPRQRGALSHLRLKVQGKWLPSFVEQLPAPRHRNWLLWGLVVPSDTIVVSMANTARVSTRPQPLPACDCQDRCELPSPCRARTRWLTRELHLLSKSGQHTQEANLSSPTPLLQDTPRDGGQTGQVGGHIGRCGETGGGATCDTRKSGKAEGQSWWPWKLAGL